MDDAFVLMQQVDDQPGSTRTATSRVDHQIDPRTGRLKFRPDLHREPVINSSIDHNDRRLVLLFVCTD